MQDINTIYHVAVPFFFLMDVYNSTKAPGSYFTPSHNAAALKASSGRRSRRARAGADSRLPSVMREAGGGRPGYRISLLTGPTAALARAVQEKKKLPAEVGQSRGASSSQMKADRWLFPGPGVSHEVSMFIMVIRTVLLTRALFQRITSQRRIPGTSKSPRSSVMR